MGTASGETPKAYAAFQAYRDQPRMERSLRRLAEELGRSVQLVARWSSRYGWVWRVEAWDAEEDRLLQEQVAAKRTEFAERLAAAGRTMQGKAYGKFRSFVERFDQDGHEVPLLPGQQYVDMMSVAEATRLIEAGARLESLGRGSPRETAPVGDPPIPRNPIIEALTADPSKIGPVNAKLAELGELLGLD